MVDYSIVRNVRYLRERGATYKGISQSIINPQTGRSYTPGTVSNWINKDVKPRAEKRISGRLKTIVRNVELPPSKRRRKYTRKLGKKFAPKPSEPEPYYEPEYYDDYEPETSYNLMEYSAGKLGPFQSFYDGELPPYYLEKGHISIKMKIHYEWFRPEEIGEEIHHISDEFGFKEWDEVATKTTSNRYNYPSEAAVEMQLIINKIFGCWDGRKSNKKAPNQWSKPDEEYKRPRVVFIEIADNYTGNDEDGNAITGDGHFRFNTYY